MEMIEMISRDEMTKLEQIENVCEDWKNSRHKWRSSHAMVKINKIMALDGDD